MKRKTNTPHPYPGVQLACGFILAVISLAVLYGWTFKPTLMVGPMANYIGTNPVSAVLFFLFGGWLLIMLKGSQRQISFLSTIVILTSFLARTTDKNGLHVQNCRLLKFL